MEEEHEAEPIPPEELRPGLDRPLDHRGEVNQYFATLPRCH